MAVFANCEPDVEIELPSEVFDQLQTLKQTFPNINLGSPKTVTSKAKSEGLMDLKYWVQNNVLKWVCGAKYGFVKKQ